MIGVIRVEAAVTAMPPTATTMDDDEGEGGTRESADETRTLERQLRELNLERASVEADGNCFFRALAD